MYFLFLNPIYVLLWIEFCKLHMWVESVFPWRDYELFLYAPYRVSIYHLYSFLLTVRKISSLFLIINAINKLFLI